MSRLLQPKNIMVSAPVQRGKYLSLLNVIQGDVDATQVHKSLQRLRQKDALEFVPWGPNAPQVVLAQRSPYVRYQHRVSGLLLANHTSMHFLLGKMLKQYDRMRKVGAYIENYRNYGSVFRDNLDEFDDSREVVRQVVDEYQSSQFPEYVSFTPSASSALS